MLAERNPHSPAREASGVRQDMFVQAWMCERYLRRSLRVRKQMDEEVEISQKRSRVKIELKTRAILT